MSRDRYRYVVPFRELTLDDLPMVGGKNASLGEMTRGLEEADVRVPDGFALTVDAYSEHLKASSVEDTLYDELDQLDIDDTHALAAVADAARRAIRAAPLPEPIAAELHIAYRALSRQYGEDTTDVAVRSSATAEDLPAASFAGQQETYLNVHGFTSLDMAVRSCLASLFTDRAIVYRVQQGIDHRDVRLSVGVQKMVRSDLASAGVIFTLDTESGFRDVVLITGAWGLGETVVQGRVNPDEFWVHKPTAAAGFRPIVRRELGDKKVRLTCPEAGMHGVREERVPAELRKRFVLDDDELLQLTRWSVAIETHYSMRYGVPTPMDIEWAKDGNSGELFIVQARPETVHARAGPPQIEIYRLTGRGRVLIAGKSVGNRIGIGPVRVAHAIADLHTFREGEVLVAEMTDPDWDPLLRKAAAVVTDQGGRTCHAAIVARELGIPCVVGCGHATETLRNGQVVTVSCAEGDEGRVYEGSVEFDRQTIDPATLPEPRVPLMLNLADPDPAFLLGQLPAAGVGLLRIEFLVSNWIGIHPMALVHPEQVNESVVRREIRRRTAGYDSREAFFVDRLASGVAQIAAAFFPRPVTVRFSDFKTNEYASLLGGTAFEPTESNPMLGFRGASRYYSDRYREGFALECAAIRRVRKDMGLTNVKVMIPFCRTVAEGRRVLEVMAEHGLRRGDDGLEVHVMCEIPNNVLLAEAFAEIFDGFSIGTNDLTQLTLGVDRDSELLTDIFDERDPGVKRMIELVIERAHRHQRPVGICGQAPSDYPEFAQWLADIGIDTISLNPDSLAQVTRRLAAEPVLRDPATLAAHG